MKQNIFFLLVYGCMLGRLSAQQTDTLRVHFLYNQSGITSAAAITIDSCLLANKNQFNIQQIELYGHCDSIGSHSYNDSLSLTRVRAVKQYLLSKDVSEPTFTKTNGFGKRQPFNSNTTEVARLLNRRVEIIIYKLPVPKPDTPHITRVTTDHPPPTLTEIIKDTATKVGSTFVLKNMNFIGGRHFLMPKSEPLLKELYQIMNDNPTLQIEIQGHICCEPPYLDGHDADLGTQDLSIQRAKYIFQSLVKMGIDASRMRYRGFGASRKLYPTDRIGMEQEMNRRVEIKILSK